MIEEEFSQYEKFEFEDRISKIKNLINDTIQKMNIDLFARAGKDKKSTKAERVCYDNGKLCLYVVCEKEKAVIELDISDETVTFTVNKKINKQLMSIQELWFAFSVYKEVKGFHRKYYRECYKKSCIRHLYSLLMNRHTESIFNTGLEDLLMESAIMSVSDELNVEK
jgi:hypothetical protein